MQTKEKNFEQDIETYFLNGGGYIKGDQSTKRITKVHLKARN